MTSMINITTKRSEMHIWESFLTKTMAFLEQRYLSNQRQGCLGVGCRPMPVGWRKENLDERCGCFFLTCSFPLPLPLVRAAGPSRAECVRRKRLGGWVAPLLNVRD